MSRARGGETVSPGPAVEQEILVSIGELIGHFTLRGSPEFLSELRDRYDPFLIPPAPWTGRHFSVDLSFDGQHALVPTRESSPMSEDHPPQVHSTRDRLRIRRWDFDVQLDSESRQGGPSWKGAGSCRDSVFAFDSLLRVLWSTFLSQEGGGLFHACGLRWNESGILFPGVSGAGKTTLARKMADVDDVLSDEIVPIRRVGKGPWRIYPSPFWGEFGRGNGSLRGLSLSSIAFLKQEVRMSAAPLSLLDAAQRLLETMLCFQMDPPAVRRNLDLAVRICSEVACVQVESSLETPPVDIFDALYSSLGTRSSPSPPKDNREVISEIRSRLRVDKGYVVCVEGASMRPSIRSGDMVFIRDIGDVELTTGDVVVYWVPGETPAGDALICHRLLARDPKKRSGRFLVKGDAHSRFDRFVDRVQVEILGKVVSISRQGKTRPISSGLGKLTRLLGSLAAVPLLKVREALR